MGNSNDALAAERERHSQLVAVLGEPVTAAERSMAKLLASWLDDREMFALIAWIKRMKLQ